ncbi:hypothetical protein BZA05DRAFT_409384 [Tricharina praecox]|uniref:uncharacterized protein n=1 Tax=Tricharina praecox TaxID=43433 RepID=UPI00221E6111|nr:uncharacterized protein BZA05DRAFT_409384 [Tricharina praecox]KAI5844797.1 hypothetical protein BZA05DRAFT_409384 [Tricharina praecox]
MCIALLSAPRHSPPVPPPTGEAPATVVLAPVCIALLSAPNLLPPVPPLTGEAPATVVLAPVLVVPMSAPRLPPQVPPPTGEAPAMAVSIAPKCSALPPAPRLSPPASPPSGGASVTVVLAAVPVAPLSAASSLEDRLPPVPPQDKAASTRGASSDPIFLSDTFPPPMQLHCRRPRDGFLAGSEVEHPMWEGWEAARMGSMAGC